MPSAEYAADTATTTSTATEAAHAAIRTANRAANISRIDPAPEPSNVHGDQRFALKRKHNVFQIVTAKCRKRIESLMRRGALSLIGGKTSQKHGSELVIDKREHIAHFVDTRGLRHIRACATKSLVHLRLAENHGGDIGRRSMCEHGAGGSDLGFYAIRRKRAFRCFGIFPRTFFASRIGRIARARPQTARLPPSRSNGARPQASRYITLAVAYTSILGDLRSASIPAISSVSISGGAKSAVALRVRD